MTKVLLIGSGHNHDRQIRCADEPLSYDDDQYELVTLDMNPDIGATVVWDMENRPLPFADEEFDEIAAFNVLEHWGQVGDWRGWFDEFAEYHRILKPGGNFRSLTPLGEDRFADPGHTRFIGPNSFGFLNQDFYQHNIDEGNPVTDYRWYYKADFSINFLKQMAKDKESPMSHLATILIKREVSDG